MKRTKNEIGQKAQRSFLNELNIFKNISNIKKTNEKKIHFQLCEI